jgi:hypothetical protein
LNYNGIFLSSDQGAVVGLIAKSHMDTLKQGEKRSVTREETLRGWAEPVIDLTASSPNFLWMQFSGEKIVRGVQ